MPCAMCAKQYQRNHGLWDKKPDEMPVFGTIASQFNDPGTNSLYKRVMDTIVEKTGAGLTWVPPLPLPMR